MKKGLYSIIFFLLFSTFTYSKVEAQQAYKDVPSNYWALEEIAFLNGKGIIGGFKDQSFKPGASITRGQAAIMMTRALKLSGGNLPDPKLKDVSKSNPYYQAVSALMKEGMLNGLISNQTFSPEKKLTRGEMASMLSKAYQLEGTFTSEFKDVSKKDKFYQDIKLLAANNITTGFSDKTFKPDQPLTRAEFSVFLARGMDDSFKKTQGKPVVTKPDENKDKDTTFNLSKVDLVKIHTDLEHYYVTNMASVFLGAKSDNERTPISESVGPDIKYFAWKVSTEKQNLAAFIKNPTKKETVSISGVGDFFSIAEVNKNPERHVLVVFYDKDKKPVSYQETIITLKPIVIKKSTSVEKLDNKGYLKKFVSGSTDFLNHSVPKEHQGLGTYYSIHGSTKDFTISDALSAEEDRIFKITENAGRSLIAISNFKENLPTSGTYYAMLIIYDHNFNPVKYVKDQFAIGE